MFSVLVFPSAFPFEFFFVNISIHCLSSMSCEIFRFKRFVERLEEKIKLSDSSSEDDSSGYQ